MSILNQLLKQLHRKANPKQAKILQRFFKTGKGEYGEGDIFLGIKVPILRKIVKNYRNLELRDTEKLLKSKIHEQRMVAILILVDKFSKADAVEKKKIYSVYMRNYCYINNWDLVDLSTPQIIGGYLFDKPRGRLYKLARSKNIWYKRMAILSTLTFIRNNEYKDSLAISKILLSDKHDLIHKAVGWMLREIGKRNQAVEEKFIQKYSKYMSRTTLRYAIERFEENKRKKYLKS